eukprot:jgi/Mesvir1/19263/Mv10343-RA.2
MPEVVSSSEHTAEGSGGKKSRVIWTAELHACFLDAIKRVGIDQVVPKTILQAMGVSGVSRESIASHLQKFRIWHRKMKEAGVLDEHLSVDDFLATHGDKAPHSATAACRRRDAQSRRHHPFWHARPTQKDGGQKRPPPPRRSTPVASLSKSQVSTGASAMSNAPSNRPPSGDSAAPSHPTTPSNSAPPSNLAPPNASHTASNSSGPSNSPTSSDSPSPSTSAGRNVSTPSKSATPGNATTPSRSTRGLKRPTASASFSSKSWPTPSRATVPSSATQPGEGIPSQGAGTDPAAFVEALGVAGAQVQGGIIALGGASAPFLLGDAYLDFPAAMEPFESVDASIHRMESMGRVAERHDEIRVLSAGTAGMIGDEPLDDLHAFLGMDVSGGLSVTTKPLMAPSFGDMSSAHAGSMAIDMDEFVHGDAHPSRVLLSCLDLPQYHPLLHHKLDIMMMEDGAVC